MPHYQLEVEGQPTWGPLERLAHLTRHCRGLPALRVDDFMYMGCLVAADRPAIHMYKHIDTRRYLHLDTAGHAFRVTPARPRPPGSALSVDCQPIRDLASALGSCRSPSTQRGMPTWRSTGAAPDQSILRMNR